MLVLYPYKNALWALRPAKPLGVLSRHPCRIPNPFPRERAILLGLPPQTKQGCLQSAAQSHCTMRWHKWLTTCTGATPLRPHFQKTQRFIDSLKYAPQNEVRIVLYSLLHCRFQALQCFFFTEQLHYSIQVGGIFSAGYRYSEYSASIGNRAFVSVGVCLVFLDVGAEA